MLLIAAALNQMYLYQYRGQVYSFFCLIPARELQVVYSNHEAPPAAKTIVIITIENKKIKK